MNLFFNKKPQIIFYMYNKDLKFLIFSNDVFFRVHIKLNIK